MTIYKSIFKKKVSPVNIIGKIIEVTFSSDPYLIGLKGRVVKETKNTIII
ncbi:MAG TPA: ribonuclease P protein subunit, partial [Thermoproteales archaeon]|nr:ribonuclease P protein subunit [Thermoproteales archaeon]